MRGGSSRWVVMVQGFRAREAKEARYSLLSLGSIGIRYHPRDSPRVSRERFSAFPGLAPVISGYQPPPAPVREGDDASLMWRSRLVQLALPGAGQGSSIRLLPCWACRPLTAPWGAHAISLIARVRRPVPSSWRRSAWTAWKQCSESAPTSQTVDPACSLSRKSPEAAARVCRTSRRSRRRVADQTHKRTERVHSPPGSRSPPFWPPYRAKDAWAPQGAVRGLQAHARKESDG